MPKPIVTIIDKKWIRLKWFRFAGFSWVLSLGSQDGRRFNCSWHRKPKPLEEDQDA